MSKYEELCGVATTKRKDWIAQRDRCWNYLGRLVHGFANYCGIPSDQLRFLRWNGITGDGRAYLDAETGSRYALPGATVFDDEDGYYHLGLRILLSPSNVLPPMWVSFILCVTEKDGKLVARIGLVGEGHQIDLNDLNRCEKFYESIVEKLKESFQDSKKKANSKIGFAVSSDRDIPPIEASGAVGAS